MNINLEIDQATSQHLTKDAKRYEITPERLAAEIIHNHYRVKQDDKLMSHLTYGQFEEFLRESTLEHAETLRRLAK